MTLAAAAAHRSTARGATPFNRRRARKAAFRRAALWGGGGVVAALMLAVLGFLFTGAVLALMGCVLALRSLHHPGGVPILVYHSVSPQAEWLPWAKNTSIRPEVLRCHLRALKAGGWTVISTLDLIHARQTGAALPRRAVVLQFDDAYLDNYLFAAPILREFNAPAMIFASSDFIAPGEDLRDAARSGPPEGWAGYMNAAELRALDADPLFDIEAHGTNHARIPVGETAGDTVAEGDWKRHAPLSWANETGDKSTWYLAKSPPEGLTAGSVLPRHDSALAGHWWRDGTCETEAEFATRVGTMLAEAHSRLGAILGRAPRVMAWPFDRCTNVSIAAAKEAGFDAVTGGAGENRTDEDPTILSRAHVQDYAFGAGPLWLEGLATWARAHSAAGHWHWHVVTVLAARARKRKFGATGYGRAS